MTDWEKIAELRRAQAEMHRSNSRLFLFLATAGFGCLLLILSTIRW